MQNSSSQHFGNDVWIDHEAFHCRGRHYLLAEIDEVYINFRVNTAIFSFLLLLVSFGCLAYGYFKFGDKGYLMLLPMVASFGMLRYTLFNYVELWIIRGGKRERVMVAAMKKREWAYGIEDAINAQRRTLKSATDETAR